MTFLRNVKGNKYWSSAWPAYREETDVWIINRLPVWTVAVLPACCGMQSSSFWLHLVFPHVVLSGVPLGDFPPPELTWQDNCLAEISTLNSHSKAPIVADSSASVCNKNRKIVPNSGGTSYACGHLASFFLHFLTSIKQCWPPHSPHRPQWTFLGIEDLNYGLSMWYWESFSNFLNSPVCAS